MNALGRAAAALSLAGMAGCLPLGPGTAYLNAEKPLGPYSGSVLSSGFCFVSGRIGESGGDFEHEARTAISELEEELARAGLTLAHVVQVTVYLTDLGDYGTLNEVYATSFSEPYPARAVVGVAALPAGARVEIQAVARRQ